MMDTVSKHFKKIDGKKDEKKFQIENIDFIYLINLDRRPQRWVDCLQQLSPYQIQPHRVSGVNGWELTQEAFDDLALIVEPSMEYDQTVQVSFQSGVVPGIAFSKLVPGQRCIHSEARGGAIGCSLSHFSILEDALAYGYETIWVLEDDFTLNGNPHDLSGLVDRLDSFVGKDGWDVLYTDDDDYFSLKTICSTYGSKYWLRPGIALSQRQIQRAAVGEEFFKIGGRTQTHSLIIRRSGMKKILDFVKKKRIFLPIDTELGCIEGLNLFNLRFDLIHGRDRKYSDTYFRT